MATIHRRYDETDSHLVDYQMYCLPGVKDGFFRGPPIQSDDYVACVGAAQTFGRFVKEPYPKLISRSLGIETLNLGRGAAGPGYFHSDPVLLNYINRARVVVVQVLSGRSQSNALFHIDHGMAGRNIATGERMDAAEFYAWLLAQDADLARRTVAECRANYVADMTKLLTAITAPKILMWWSTRDPEYAECWTPPASRLLGKFPHLVNREMMDRIKDRADRYVECVSRRGWPQPIVDLQGNPASFRVESEGQSAAVIKTENRYYPSPEMHEDAAAALAPICLELLGRSTRTISG
jgi:hypothetical protein